MLSKQDKLFFVYSIKNFKYLIWLSELNFQLFVPGIHLKYQFGSLGFLIFYPFVALFDSNWKEQYGFTGELYELPFILERDRINNYKVSKNVQSKYYWYETFTKYSALLKLASIALYLLIKARVSLKSSSLRLSFFNISSKNFLSSSFPF